MTRKRDALAKSLADLLLKHSSSDWEYVADRFEEVGRLARALGQQAESAKIKKRRNSRPKNSIITRAPDTDHLSPVTREFALYLAEKSNRQSLPRLRDLAISLGIKPRLSMGSAEITKAIYTRLENVDEEARIEKIRAAIIFLEDRSPSQSDHYDRWVSLITKSRNTD